MAPLKVLLLRHAPPPKRGRLFVYRGPWGWPLLLCEDGALTFRVRGGILVSSRIPCALEVSLNSGIIITDRTRFVKTFFQIFSTFFWGGASPLGGRSEVPVRPFGLVEGSVLMPEPHGDIVAEVAGVAKEGDEAEVLNLVAAARLNGAEAFAFSHVNDLLRWCSVGLNPPDIMNYSTSRAGLQAFSRAIHNLFTINFYSLLVCNYAFSGIVAPAAGVVIFCKKLSPDCNRGKPTRCLGALGSARLALQGQSLHKKMPFLTLIRKGSQGFCSVHPL